MNFALACQVFLASFALVSAHDTRGRRLRLPKRVKVTKMDLPEFMPTEDLPEITPTEYLPTDFPSLTPDSESLELASESTSLVPSDAPSMVPSDAPSMVPSDAPSMVPSDAPSMIPSDAPSMVPSPSPTPWPDVKWAPTLNDINSPGEAPDFLFGSTLSMSKDGSIVAVLTGGFNGTVSVYEINSDGWAQIGEPIPAINNQGIQLTPDGTDLLVHGLDAQVFQFVDNAWIQVGEDIPSQSTDSSSSISDDGLTVAIGLPGATTLFSSVGSVEVYSFDGSAWNLIRTIDGDESDDRNFGRHLSLSGDGNTLSVSGRGTSSIANVYVKTYHIADTVYLLGRQDAAPNNGNYIVPSLSRDGSRLAILDPAGKVRSFKFEAAEWKEVSNGLPESFDPRVVRGSTDGTSLIMCNPNLGTVKVFALDEETWVERGEDIGDAEIVLLGRDCALSGDGSMAVASGWIMKGTADGVIGFWQAEVVADAE